MENNGKYADDILKMKPVSAFIFDCHSHIGPIGTMRVHDGGSAEGLIEMMNLAGIDKAAFSHMLGISGDAVNGNILGYDAACRYAGRLCHYLVYDPNLNKAEMLESIHKYIDDETTVGVKLHPMWHGTAPDDPRYEPVMELADEREMPVLIHTWGRGEVLAAERLARRHPRSCIIIGHSGGAEYAAIDEAARAAAENANIRLDLTMSLIYDGLPEYLLTKVPVEKILFGSDMNYLDPRSLIGRLAFAAISDSDKAKIFGGNFLSIIAISALH